MVVKDKDKTIVWALENEQIKVIIAVGHGVTTGHIYFSPQLVASNLALYFFFLNLPSPHPFKKMYLVI